MATAETRQLTLGNFGSDLSIGFSGYLAVGYLASLMIRGKSFLLPLALPSNRAWAEVASMLGGGGNQGRGTPNSSKIIWSKGIDKIYRGLVGGKLNFWWKIWVHAAGMRVAWAVTLSARRPLERHLSPQILYPVFLLFSRASPCDSDLEGRFRQRTMILVAIRTGVL